jgi:hypothetical protein
VGAYAALLAGSTAVFGLDPLRVQVIHAIEAILNVDAGPWLTQARVGLGSVALTVLAFVVGSLLCPGRSDVSAASAVED